MGVLITSRGVSRDVSRGVSRDMHNHEMCNWFAVIWWFKVTDKQS